MIYTTKLFGGNMEEYNVKCSKCGYIFFDDSDSGECTCPLCQGTTGRKAAEEAYKAVEENYYKKKKRSNKRIAVDMIIFGFSFAAFVLLMYFLISLIIALGR
jgi:hypothetical protein